MVNEVEGDQHLITECSAQEFRDYMRENGLNIDFISDRTLDAEDIKFRHRIRRAGSGNSSGFHLSDYRLGNIRDLIKYGVFY